MNIFKLNKKAILMDSWLYIIKAFISVSLAYLIFSPMKFVGRDMISVLFGMMLTLEPITFSGFKRGFEQTVETIIGALTTATIIHFFGINFITVGLGVAATIYVGLKINWRFVPPVMIFTAIYMTQYVQTNLLGEPSVVLTLALRMSALLSGVMIAMAMNFIFHVLFSHNMICKRTKYLHVLLNENISLFSFQLENENLVDVLRNMPNTFNEIDWVYSQVEDLEKQNKFFKKDVSVLSKHKRILINLRRITHGLYDMCVMMKVNSKIDKEIIGILEVIKRNLSFPSSYLEVPEYDNDPRIKENLTMIIKELKELLVLESEVM